MGKKIKQVCETPRIFIIDDFISEDEILHILSYASDQQNFDTAGIKSRFDATGFSFEYPSLNDVVLQKITHRLEEHIPVINQLPETMRFRHYMPDQSHPPHLDTYDINNQTLIITAIMYLNDVDKGGETYFPDARPEAISVIPKSGRLAIWFGHLPDGEVDSLSLHEGLPVISGNKFTLTSFIYSDAKNASINLIHEAVA